MRALTRTHEGEFCLLLKEGDTNSARSNEEGVRVIVYEHIMSLINREKYNFMPSIPEIFPLPHLDLTPEPSKMCE